MDRVKLSRRVGYEAVGEAGTLERLGVIGYSIMATNIIQGFVFMGLLSFSQKINITVGSIIAEIA
jgi:hypothetical protein